MPKTGLLSIPDEILEDIFNQLDGKTFFNLRRINRRIKNLIDYILQRYDAKQWQKLCLETIPANFLIDYINTGHSPKLDTRIFQYCENDIDLSWVKWKQIFQNHMVLNNDTFWIVAQKKYIDLDLNDPVTCMKITGDYILTGHHSGLICLWSDDEFGGQLLMDVYEQVHSCFVTDILPIDIFHQGPYNLHSDSGGVTNIQAGHHFFVSASLKGQVQARGLGLSDSDGEQLRNLSQHVELAIHNQPCVHIACMGDHLASMGRDNSIMLWEIIVPVHYKKTPWHLPRFIPMANFIGPSSTLFLGTLWPNKMAFWMNKFVILTRNGNTEAMHYSTDRKWIQALGGKSGMKLIESKSGPTDKKNLVLINSSNHFGVKTVSMKQSQDPQKIFKIFGHIPEDYRVNILDLAPSTLFARIFHDDCFVLCTKTRQICISVDGVHFKICGPFKNSERGHVSAVIYYANIFALAFTCGTIQAYFTKDPIDLLSINFAEKPQVTLKASIWPLICMDMKIWGEQSVILAVCSESDVEKFVIRPPPNF